MPVRELKDIILEGLIARRLPEWNERIQQIAQETLRSLGGSATLEMATKAAVQRLKDGDPALYSAWERISMEAYIVAEAIDAGCTVDASGTIHLPA